MDVIIDLYFPIMTDYCNFFFFPCSDDRDLMFQAIKIISKDTCQVPGLFGRLKIVDFAFFFLSA